MGTNTKNSVFALGLMALGVYVVYESNNMLARAARPPYNVKEFSISPGMLPLVLGCALLLFALALLLTSIRGGGENSLGSHLAVAFRRFAAAIGSRDVISMTVCTAIMFVYTFLIVGSVPFWFGAALFLVAIMVFLRASSWWIILLSSGISIAVIVILFQNFFRTTLP